MPSAARRSPPHRTLRVILLAALALYGCDSTCEPTEEAFVVDEILSSKDVTVMVAWWGLSSSSELKCPDVCQYVYEDRTGWVNTAVHDCAMSVTETGGDIQCTGDGFEDSCP